MTKIQAPLSFFDDLQRLAHVLHTPLPEKLAVGNDYGPHLLPVPEPDTEPFQLMLARLDECIVYMQNHVCNEWTTAAVCLSFSLFVVSLLSPRVLLTTLV